MEYERRLVEAGIPANLKGTKYLAYAIEHCESTQSTMALYEKTAAHFGVTAKTVMHCMRSALDKASIDIALGTFISKAHILGK